MAGTKGLGISASYCASKRYHWTYLQAIDQLARSQHANIRITDIRPGFVRTDLLKEFPTPLPLEMSIGHAATRIERAIISGRRVATIDRRWAIVTAIWRLIPDFLWPRLTIKLK